MPTIAYKILLLILGEKLFLRAKYYYRTGKPLRLQNPVTFSEKIQWLKIHNRQPLMRTLADKILCKEWVADKIGPQYVIPLLKTFNSPADLTPENLPDPPFVLKASHDSGGVKVISSHADLTPDAIRNLQHHYASRMHSFYYFNLEWEYKDITPRILAEPLIRDNNVGQLLRDYKIHCFNGEPRFIQTFSDRFHTVKTNWFDTHWHPQEMWYFSKHRAQIPKPPCLDEMLSLARTLSKPFPYVRVDFYWTGNQVLFGEVTFRPYGGFMVWNDPQVDLRLGEMLTLPNE